VATAMALVLFPDFQLALLIAIAIWAFCRAFYFAFYVIEHYVDPSFRFAGLSSFATQCDGEKARMRSPLRGD